MPGLLQRLAPLLIALTALAACQESPSPLAAPDGKSSPAASTGAAPAPTKAAAPAAAGARSVDEETGLYSYEYSYPAQAGTIPALKEWLDADIDRRRSELAGEAKESRDEAKKADFPYNTHSRLVAWSVVADLPAWLSLSATVGSYSGGAHPNHGYAELIWDKVAGIRRSAGDLFASKPALSRAIRADFCRAIDKQRAEKRGVPVRPGSSDMFDQCIDPADSTVILGSSNRRSFDRIGILVGPYEAGPYAEGDYEVTLPVTPAVLAAVRPEYRSAFALRR